MMKMISANKIIKRVFDLCISSVMLILLSPGFLIISFLIWLFEGRPILYKSSRFTKPDRQVVVYKFRSMVQNTEDPKYQLVERYMKDGFMDIPLHSEVYTPIGRFLEKTQLVETLQFWNVFLGQMSLVGNRPLPELNMRFLRKKNGWEKRMESPAGMTGISQIVGKYNLTPEQRLRLEALYSDVYNNGSVILCDFYIIFRTFILIIGQQGLPFEKAEQFLLKCIKEI